MTKIFGMEKDNIEYQAILDKLLLGNPLNEEEKILVENNPHIQHDLNEMKLIKKGLTKVHLEEKKQMLADFEKEKYSNVSKPKRALPAILFSSFLSLLIIAYLAFKAFSQPVDISKYFTPYPFVPADEKENLRDDYKYYNDGVYNQANPIFDSHLKEISNNKDLFYYGVSLIGSGNSLKAIEVLNNPALLADKNYPANFYLGLAYFETDKDLARIHLEQSQDFNPEIKEKAKQLLSFLK